MDAATRVLPAGRAKFSVFAVPSVPSVPDHVSLCTERERPGRVGGCWRADRIANIVKAMQEPGAYSTQSGHWEARGEWPLTTQNGHNAVLSGGKKQSEERAALFAAKVSS